MNKSTPRRTSRLISAGIATGVVAAAVIIGTPTPALAAAATLTLSSANGTAAGGNTLTATSTTAAAFLTGVTTPHTTFSLATCQTTYNSTASTSASPPSSASVGNVIYSTGTTPIVTTKVSNTKAMILVPTGIGPLPSGVTSLAYKVCIYKSSTADSELAGTATYTVSTPPGANPTVTPDTGPALGGTQITVSGTNFPTTAGSISGKLGGVALTSVTPVSSTGFTAIAPLHAPGQVTLDVTTAAGTISKTNAYTYSNGVIVSPSTAPSSSTATYVDVLGAGFLNYTFNAVAWATTPTTDARVYLVVGAYDPGATTATWGATGGPTAECITPTVISDTELICKLNLAAGKLNTSTGAAMAAAVPDGTYTLTVVNNGSDVADKTLDTYLQSDVSSGATFTVADYN